MITWYFSPHGTKVSFSIQARPISKKSQSHVMRKAIHKTNSTAERYVVYKKNKKKKHQRPPARTERIVLAA